MVIQLDDYQHEAVKQMKNGCILVGGVGSGKSRTGLAYYFTQNGGGLDPYKPMKKPKDLYIITTAKNEIHMNGKASFVHIVCLPIQRSTFIKTK